MFTEEKGMKMKKQIKFYISLCLLVTLTGCIDQNSNTNPELTQIIDENSKIVATSISVLEICEMLDINLVATPSSDSYTIPKKYENLPIIGNGMAVDIEVLSTLDVDLVLSPKSLENDLKSKYEAIGVDYLFLDLTSTDSMYDCINELGQLFNNEESATSINNEYIKYKKDLVDKQINDSTVLVLMGLPGSYVVATNKSYVGSLIEMAGLKNIYTDDDEAFLNVSVEDMLLHQPDYIFTTSHAMPEMVSQMFLDEFENNAIWSNFNAVQDKKIFDLDHNYFGMSAKFNYNEAISILMEILEGE